MEIQILLDIFIVFGVTVVVIILCNFLKIPYLMGYLLTGVLLSPNTTSLLQDAEEVDTYAEVGIILLLFTVGLEFSFSNLKRIRHYVLVGGALQVLFTAVLATAFIGLAYDTTTWNESIFWGLLYAPSSTAIVIKILQDKVKINTAFGKVVLAVLLFQDLIVVPFMLFVPILAGEGGNPVYEVLIMVGKLLLVAGIAYVLARFVIPRFLDQIMKIQSQEVFLIATIFLVAGITLLTSEFGLSLALGAFIAGIMVAETDYNRLAISCFLPFRYVFISFFFISMGMLLDYHIFLTDIDRVAFWLGFSLLVKVLAGTLAARVLKVSWKTALAAGLSIAQIGEFSFVLAQSGLSYQLIDANSYQVFLAVSILTMMITPLVVNRAEKLAASVLKLVPKKRITHEQAS